MAVPAQYGNQISCFRIDVSSALSTSAEYFLYLLPAIAITSSVELMTKNIYCIPPRCDRQQRHGETTVGIGGGQPNRVDCVHIAAQKAGQKSRAAVMASDAFFSFPDAVEVAAEKGITAIVQPGGSIRDQDSIDVCNQHGIAMVLTGVRHFRH